MTERFDSNRIDRYYRHEFSQEEASYIENIFSDNTNIEELETLLYKQFIELETDDDADIKNLDHILYNIHYNINMKKSGIRPIDSFWKWTIRIGAAIMFPIALFAGIHTYKESQLKKETWIEFKAPAWTRAEFNLPDGSNVWLNSNSAVKYSGNFNKDRKIILTGEAFFDVKEIKKRPFTVSTGDISVKVLGTRFNVASYEDERNIEVVLEEGELLFRSEELNKSFIMKPNDMIAFDKSQKNISTEIVQVQKYCSWKEGMLVFRNDALDVIARRLERWYNVDVEIHVSSPEDIRWRATFIDENLEEVLIFMKKSLAVDYRIVDGNIQQDNLMVKKKVILYQNPL